MSAQIIEAAVCAFGGAGGADIPSVKYEPMMSQRQCVVLKIFYKFFLDTEGGGAPFWNKTYSVTDTENVCVNGHCLSAECYG